jgi:receptor-type tyrosine-protein phosphatase F
VPGEPTSVRVSAVNSTTLHVSWKPPAEKDRNGIVRGYHIHIHEVKDEVTRGKKLLLSDLNRDAFALGEELSK